MSLIPIFNSPSRPVLFRTAVCALAYDLFEAVALTAFAVAVALAAIWAGA